MQTGQNIAGCPDFDNMGQGSIPIVPEGKIHGGVEPPRSGRAAQNQHDEENRFIEALTPQYEQEHPNRNDFGRRSEQQRSPSAPRPRA